MKKYNFIKKPICLALAIACAGITVNSFADVDLMAVDGVWSPDGTTTLIPMWGYVTDVTGSDPCPVAPVAWTPGPQITDADLVGGDLTINLRNCLSEPTSLIIPGQATTFVPTVVNDSFNRPRIMSFTNEVAADSGASTTAYTWSNAKAGSYIYQSGSRSSKQVHMGLYGAMTTGVYANTGADVTLLYSEIDPALHATASAATPTTYNPRYYLVNGSDAAPTLAAGNHQQATVLRFLNAGLDYHVPSLNGSYMKLVAEDGNAYPYPKQQYSANVAAGKTIDALWQPASDGNYVIRDRRGNGLVATLSVGAGTGTLPTTASDTYTLNEDEVLATTAGSGTVGLEGVLDNDDTGLTAQLISAPVHGVLSSGLATDGSFTYVPSAEFSGTDGFSYKASNGSLDSVETTVTINVTAVNDTPVAGDDSYAMFLSDGTLTVSVPGILTNDTDVDGPSLTAVLDVFTPTSTASTLSLIADGSFDYTPDPALTADIVDTFTYHANDGSTDSTIATVSIAVTYTTPPPVNHAPVAVEDFPRIKRNTLDNFINLTANDSDEDGNLSTVIQLVDGTTTSRGGTVSVTPDGVLYTPKRRFNGTDTFRYIVLDLDGLASNIVSVRINVVRRL